MTERILETPRLVLRAMDAADLPALRGMLQDEAVMAAYEGTFGEDEVRAWLDNQLRRYKEDGMGLWAVCLKPGGEMIGQCGLTWQRAELCGEERRVPEVGYMFGRAHWRRGYATEAALACRDHAFKVLGFGAVYAIIRDTNLPSQQVARRCGMRPVGVFVKHYRGVEMPHIVFEVRREAAGDDAVPAPAGTKHRDKEADGHEAVRRLVLDHLRRYPGMEPEDALKLLHQSVMGGEHLIEDEAAFAGGIAAEMAQPGVMTANPPAPEPIGGGLCRVHLSALYKGPATATLARLCRLSAAAHRGETATLRDRLGVLPAMEAGGLLPWPAGTMARRVEAYIKEGCPPLHHSGRFRALYAPHYRIMDADMALYLPVLAAIDGALGQKPHVLLAVDGMSGAGKSALAGLLQRVYGCGLVHCDDFFLRPHQRTALRLAQAGGNIDYERLAPVAALAAEDRAFSYQAYDCQTGEMGEWRAVPAGRLTVLEGVYAHHPAVAARADVRAFLAVEAGAQGRRVRARSGPALAERFASEWIPMENRYFVEFGIREGADVVVDTTALG